MSARVSRLAVDDVETTATRTTQRNQHWRNNSENAGYFDSQSYGPSYFRHAASCQSKLQASLLPGESREAPSVTMDLQHQQQTSCPFFQIQVLADTVTNIASMSVHFISSRPQGLMLATCVQYNVSPPFSEKLCRKCSELRYEQCPPAVKKEITYTSPNGSSGDASEGASLTLQ